MFEFGHLVLYFCLWGAKVAIICDIEWIFDGKFGLLNDLLYICRRNDGIMLAYYIIKENGYGTISSNCQNGL